MARSDGDEDSDSRISESPSVSRVPREWSEGELTIVPRRARWTVGESFFSRAPRIASICGAARKRWASQNGRRSRTARRRASGVSARQMSRPGLRTASMTFASFRRAPRRPNGVADLAQQRGGATAGEGDQFAFRRTGVQKPPARPQTSA